MTDRDRNLEAPHRRLETAPPRIVERSAVASYRLAAALLAHVPPRVSTALVATAAQASYLAWPVRRRFSNANFGHVLGLPPDHAAVRRLALRAYREYARYVVELMRLPSRPMAELVDSVDSEGLERLEATWRASGRPLILAAGHVGSNEAVMAALAGRGYPVNVIADDSSFPELFDLLRRQREAWGVRLIPWRNLRDLFGVLKRNEILTLLVDWGYREDGIPVQLFGSWTTLPAGPATLAARSGALIAFVAIRRTDSRRLRIEAHGEFTVPSSSPEDLQLATQRIADALEATIAAAPDQWYSFKPIWPGSPDEARRLEERAGRMRAGQAEAGQGARAEAGQGARAEADLPVRAEADRPVRAEAGQPAAIQPLEPGPASARAPTGEAPAVTSGPGPTEPAGAPGVAGP